MIFEKISKAVVDVTNAWVGKNDVRKYSYTFQMDWDKVNGKIDELVKCVKDDYGLKYKKYIPGGVYVILDGLKCMYVGKGWDWCSRIRQHNRSALLSDESEAKNYDGSTTYWEYFKSYKGKKVTVLFFEYDGPEDDIMDIRLSCIEGALKCAYRPEFWNK